MLSLIAIALLAFAGGTACERKHIKEHRASSGGGLRAEIYSFNATGDAYLFQKKLLSRIDREINFVLRGNATLAPVVPRDRFSIRWTGYLIPPKTGKLMLCTCTDDGVKLTVGGEEKFNYMNPQSARFWGAEIDTVQGERLPIKIEYFDGGGDAVARLYWAESPGKKWDEVCRNFSPPEQQQDGTLRDVAPERCRPEDTINPELKIITSEYLEPSPQDADAVLAECQQEPGLLDPSRASDPADSNTQRARKLYQRLAGLDLPLFDPRIEEVRTLLNSGRIKDAARRVSREPSFYDKTVRSVAARISTRAERPDVPLNDFIATFVGVTRDRIDARKLLTGNFVYRAKPELFYNDSSIYSSASVLESNAHYEALEMMNAPLACALDRIDRFNPYGVPEHMIQKVAIPSGTVFSMRDNPDPAGLLTTRSFAEAHIIAGTNRRPVEKAFEYFLCAPIDSWRDAELSDEYVGRDVERFPNGAGSFSEFLNGCKTCHAPMDAMRGAFAYYHFENGLLKYGPIYHELGRHRSHSQTEESRTQMKLTPCASGDPGCNSRYKWLPVAWKLNHNVNFAAGHTVTDDSFTNLLTTPRHALRFGWSGGLSGTGVRQFGRMIANSRAFPACMAKRVYAEVCKDNPFREDFPPELSRWIEQAGEEFATQGYDLKDLFESLALSCMD